MTKYISLQDQQLKARPSKKTVFNSGILKGDNKIYLTRTMGGEWDAKPEDYDKVIWLGYSEGYGDVFQAWTAAQRHDPADFVIFFGEKGDEF